MRIILGLDAPTSGTAVVNQRRYDTLVRPLRQVGALLDATAVHGGRTARLHLASVAQRNGIGPRRFTLIDAARQLTALHPQPDLFAPAASLLVLLAWPAAALLAAALLISRRDI